jgi:hypothetical protein
MFLLTDGDLFFQPFHQQHRYKKNKRGYPLPKADQTIKIMLEKEI